MTVTASPADVPGTYAQGVGKGQALLNAITELTGRIANAPAGSVQAKALGTALGIAQIDAVQYFMASYWLYSGNILAAMVPTVIDATARGLIKQIAARTAQLPLPPPAALVYGNEAPQYSQYMPPYPNAPPDAVLDQLQTQLVNYYMTTPSGITAAGILSTMTGGQAYVFPYNTDGQFFSPYGEGDVDTI